MQPAIVSFLVLLGAFIFQTSLARSETIEQSIDPGTAASTSTDGKQIPQEVFKPKSPSVAGWLSVGSYASLAGIATFSAEFAPEKDGWSYYFIPPLALAVTVAPSAGHLYSGEYGHALAFSGLRLVLFGSAAAAFTAAAFSDNPEAGAVFLVGMLGWLGLTVYDLIDAPRSAHRHNEREREEQRRSRESR